MAWRRRFRAPAALLVCVAWSSAALCQAPPCEQATVCKQSSSPPADDWFRHGLEALAEFESTIATCALEKASQLNPKEDGHNLSSFVKPMLGGVNPPPRDCTQSSAPLDKKKYFPRLYLAKAYFDWALRSQEAEKREYCEKALESLAGSRDSAPLAKVQQQWERRMKIARALEDSRCCDLLSDASQCAEESGGAG